MMQHTATHLTIMDTLKRNEEILRPDATGYSAALLCYRLSDET